MSLLWGSVNNGQPFHGLHITKSLRTSALDLQHHKTLPGALPKFKKIFIVDHKKWEGSLTTKWAYSVL